MMDPTEVIESIAFYACFVAFAVFMAGMTLAFIIALLVGALG